MSINIYKPHSHFFVDHNNLYDANDAANPGSKNTDAFGPVVGNETTQYRTTSFIRASATSKVFAICDGHILIQPYDGDSTKVNLIIKPTVSYAPLKIKYFIYRGVNKDDLIFGFDLVHPTPDSPEFIKRVWKASNKLAEALNQPLPLNLDAKLIGYNPGQLDDELLSYIFFGIETEDEYNIPKCFKGEFIGNFTGRIGLDIVLDYGDYELDYEEQLFKLDLGYARKPEHIFDVSTITGAVKQKRYREYIHQFIDTAAFWGSHIDCGEILLYNNIDPKTDTAGIYPLVSKYQTANKLYLYIQAERGRSYNYFGEYPTNNISFELQGRGTTFLPYTTEGVWPILIKSFTRTTITGVTIGIKNIGNSNLINIDKHRATYIRASNWERDSLINHSTTTDTSIFNYTVRKTNNSANQITIANMILIHHLGNENQLYPYYNQTFGLVNIKATIYDIDSLTDGYNIILNNINPKLLTTSSINRFRNAIINTKVVFDERKKTNSSEVKKRRLYISKIVDLPQEDSQYITSTPISKYVKKNNESYYLDLYGSTDFKIYKGELNDSSAIQTLTLVNSKNHLLKQSYFHLGILEEEYNKLMYNSLIIPDPLPSPAYIPKDAANIRFYMEEDSSNINDYENKDYRRFKLGVNYENNTGNLEHKFPSSPIFIYTIDGFFFFSSGYSEYQDIFKTFSKSSVHFRPLENWRGDYGFDWIRIGDYEIDTSIENIKYFNILGHYYDNSIPPKKNPNEPEATATFLKEKVEWQTFHRLYPSYAKLKTINSQLDTYSQYASSFLTLYPSLDINDNPLPFPKESTSLTQKCFTERFIGLNVHIDDSQISLKIRFETKHFDINSIPLSTTTEIPDSIDPQKYTCLLINENEMEGNKMELRIKALREFRENKKIQVLATKNTIEELAGEMIVKANAKSLRKETKVLFVNVITEIGGVVEEGIDFVNSTIGEELEDLITPFFNQSIIDIVDIAKLGSQLSPNPNLSLNVTPSQTTIFNAKYVDSSGEFSYKKVDPAINTDLSGNPITNSNENNIHYDLLKFLTVQHPSYAPLYKDYLVVFFLGVNDTTSSPGSYVNGVGLYNSGLTIVMKNGIGTSGSVRTTTAHELMHAIGLYHTFDSRNEYTFKQYITDNIMDYNKEGLSPPERVSTSEYQKKIINKNSFITDEK